MTQDEMTSNPEPMVPGSEKALVQARHHVRRGEQLVREQRGRVEELRRGGHDTDDAEQLLGNLEIALRVLRDHLVMEESAAGKKGVNGQPESGKKEENEQDQIREWLGDRAPPR